MGNCVLTRNNNSLVGIGPIIYEFDNKLSGLSSGYTATEDCWIYLAINTNYSVQNPSIDDIIICAYLWYNNLIPLKAGQTFKGTPGFSDNRAIGKVFKALK